MQTQTRVFLASSSELAAERELFQLRASKKNKMWHRDGIFLHVDAWEDVIDSLSRTRSQDEYNAAILQADIFVLLVHTKVGKYSREELETAMRQFNATGKPRIYIYFKQPAIPAAPGPEFQTVRDLKAHLAQLDQFPPQPYEHPAEMLDHFNQQLDKLRDTGFIQAALPPSAAAQKMLGAQAVNIEGDNHAPVNTGTIFNTGRIGFSNALFRPFSFPMAPRTRRNTAPGALESVFGGGCGLLGVDSAAENRPSRAPSAGYPSSSGRFHRSGKPSDAADSSGPASRVA